MEINDKEKSNNLFTFTVQQSGFSQLLSKIKNRFFAPTAPTELDPEVKLKAKKIDGDASLVLSRLIDVKTRLESELDNETYGYLVRILNPLADDVKKMNGLLNSATQIEEISKVMERYHRWMVKAKSWIHLGSENNRSEHIVQGIVEHLIGELHTSIDRDIESITNYRQQLCQLLTSETPAESEEIVLEKLTLATMPHINALYALKERKIHPELEKFTEWKRWVNSRRAVLFENALLVLDEHKA